MGLTKSYFISKQIVPQQINSINISVRMAQFSSTSYHFCTLNEQQTPKQLPSVDFVAKLSDICNCPNTLFEQAQRNIYDRKNHVLYINNYEAYRHSLKQKYGRSVQSFQKQLTMMGYKKRKIKQFYPHSSRIIKQESNFQVQPNEVSGEKNFTQRINQSTKVLGEQSKNNRHLNQGLQQKENQGQKYMFVWRTNRQKLIQKQLNTFQDNLQQEISKAIGIRDKINKRKNQLDSKLQTLIFQHMINQNDFQISVQSRDNSISKDKYDKKNNEYQQILQKFLRDSLKELKAISNDTQLQSKNFIVSISQNLSNELDLYRLLIFKQAKVHHIDDFEEQE